VEKRKLGKTVMQVSALGFGGAEIGFSGSDEKAVHTLLNRALDAGLNVVDSAAAYLTSEELIGKAISHRRGEFYLLTKCGALDGFSRSDWSYAGLIRSAEASLQRLRTDYVDVIQLHSCSEELLRAGEVIRALQKLRDAGKARYIGYSGDNSAAKYAVECGAFDTLQTSISIADQRVLETVLPLAHERGMGVIAKRPIANAAWRTGKKPQNSYHHAYWERLQKLDYGFLHGELKAGAAAALRFTIFQPGVHVAIVGTTNPERWAENAAIVAQGPLPPEQVSGIRARWREIARQDWVGQE